MAAIQIIRRYLGNMVVSFLGFLRIHRTFYLLYKNCLGDTRKKLAHPIGSFRGWDAIITEFGQTPGEPVVSIELAAKKDLEVHPDVGEQLKSLGCLQ